MTTGGPPLRVGDQLPMVRHSCDILQSAIFADCTGNYHRIHWDQEYARSEGLSSAIVNSGVLMAWVEEYIQNTYGITATWKKMDFKFEKPVPIGSTVSCGGSIKNAFAEHENSLTLQISIWIRGLEGSVHLTGEAVIEINDPK
jgi:acyl dehydratase